MSQAVLAVAEQNDGVFRKVTFEALSAGRRIADHLGGELAAVVLEAGVSARYGRVCTQNTIPFARILEDQTLPSTNRILVASQQLLEHGG